MKSSVDVLSPKLDLIDSSIDNVKSSVDGLTPQLAAINTGISTFQQSTDNKLDGLHLSLDGLKVSVEDTTQEVHDGLLTVNQSLSEIKSAVAEQSKTWSYSYVWDSNNLLQQETKTNGSVSLTRFYTWTIGGLLETITNWEAI